MRRLTAALCLTLTILLGSLGMSSPNKSEPSGHWKLWRISGCLKNEFSGVYEVSETLFSFEPSELWVSDFPPVLPLAYLHNPMIPIPAAIPMANMDEATLSPISVLTIIKFSPHGFSSKSAV